MEKEKLLEFIQDVINRLSNQCFLIKGWTITLITALLIFSKGAAEVKYNLLFAFLIIMFGGLDGYYLRQERIFRAHFNKIVQSNEQSVYNMDVSYLKKDVSYISCIFSITNIIFYASLLSFLLIFNFLI